MSLDGGILRLKAHSDKRTDCKQAPTERKESDRLDYAVRLMNIQKNKDNTELNRQRDRQLVKRQIDMEVAIKKTGF